MVPPWLYNTVLRIEEQPDDRVLCIPIGGVRNLGKTTGLIQIMRHLGSKQTPDDNGVRTLSFGILRETYSDFDQIIESFSEWFDEHDSYSSVRRGDNEGFAYKELTRSPKIITYERTPDLVSFLLDGTSCWDGTYTRLVFRGYSFNKPTADARMRGQNLGSGWVNEAQTLAEKPISTLMGTINRPTGKIKNSVLLIDFNLPERDDNGYDFLKRLLEYDGDSYAGDEDSMDVYFPEMPAPYSFEPDPEGTFIFEGVNGRLAENPEFLIEAPHLTDLKNYAQYKLLSDDEKRRNMFGKFGKKNNGNIIYTEFDKRKHVGEVKPPVYEDHKDNLILMPIDFGLNPAVLFSYVEDGTIYIFHEMVIKDINFYELLSSYVVPYCETALEEYYDSTPDAPQRRIKPIGDPTSGSRRDYMKSAQPVKVLIGDTDINGDEAGDAERFHFVEAVASPCGNVVQHRLQVSKQALSRPNGVLIDRSCRTLIDALDGEYVAGAGGSPVKKGNTIYHNAADAFQYVCVYAAAGLETKIIHKKKRKRKPNRTKKHTKYV